MAIGQHVAKYQAQKQQREQTEQEPLVAENETTEQPTMAAAFTMMAELLKEMRESKGTPDDQDRRLAETERLLLEQKRLQLETDREARNMPENRTHSGLSVYWPDPRVPKPELKTKFSWVGYDLVNGDTLRPDEVEALNLLEPGDYMVTKADGNRINFKVTAKYADQLDSATGMLKLESMSVSFNCKGENKHNHLSLASYCRQATSGAIPNADDLLREVARLKAELSAKSVMTAV